MPIGLMAIVTLASCADTATGPAGVSIADLAGAWEGSQFAISPEGDPGPGLDLIGRGGTLLFSFQLQGDFKGAAALPGTVMGRPEIGVFSIPLSGAMSIVNETTMRMVFFPEIPPFFVTLNPEFTLSGNTLTILDEGVSFDFDQDGVKETAVFRGTLIRR